VTSGIVDSRHSTGSTRNSRRGNDRFEWVDDDAQSAVTAQRDAPKNFDGGWWTTDGWKALVEDTTTGLGTELQRSWEAHLDQQEIPSSSSGSPTTRG